MATALVFGLMHGHPIAIIYATCLGILLGWLYCQTESLLTTIIFHIVYNLFSVIAPEMSDVAYVIMGFAGIVISVVCVVFISRLPKYTPPKDEGDNDKSDEV